MNGDWSRVPGIRPAVEDIFETAEGNLWIRTPSSGDGVLFDVYSRDVTYLGTASVSPGLNLFDRVTPVVRDDLVWLIVTDELDVPYVVRARIAPRRLTRSFSERRLASEDFRDGAVAVVEDPLEFGTYEPPVDQRAARDRIRDVILHAGCRRPPRGNGARGSTSGTVRGAARRRSRAADPSG